MNDRISDKLHKLDAGTIHLALDGVITTVILNNPTRLNALPQQLWEDLPRIFGNAVADGFRVIVLTGIGDNFCAGADISEFAAVRKNADTARNYEKANEEAFAASCDTPVPVIVQICSICFGSGFGLAADCDLRIASEDARFSVPAARLGLADPVAAMADIVHAVGAQNAKRLFYTADRFAAGEMLTMGFVSEIVSPPELENHVSAIAQRIATFAPLTHRATKVVVGPALGGSAAIADKLGAATFASADYAEGRAAFREKRQPEFRGD